MRTGVVLFPFAAFLFLEGIFYLSGWYGSEENRFENRHIEFEEGTPYFAEWGYQLKMPKPSSIYRIFTVGGSSTMGFGVDRPFSELLQASLIQQQPDWLKNRNLEIINGGREAFGSHRVLEVVKWASLFEPDLIVVYLGHNEFLEEIFFDPSRVVFHFEKAERLAQKSRVANWLRFALIPERSIPKPKLQRHVLSDSSYPWIKSQQQYEIRLKFFEANLEQIVACCQERKVRLLFMPVARNLLWEPQHSVHGPGYASHSDEWETLFARVQTQFEKHEWAKVISTLRRIHQIDDKYSLTHYQLGLSLLAIGDARTGKQELVVANQLDRTGDRANSDVVRVIHDVCKRHGLPFVDVQPAFDRELLNESRRLRSGQDLELFLDHCHPAQKAHVIISDAIAKFLMQDHLTRDQR